MKAKLLRKVRQTSKISVAKFGFYHLTDVKTKQQLTVVPFPYYHQAVEKAIVATIGVDRYVKLYHQRVAKRWQRRQERYFLKLKNKVA